MDNFKNNEQNNLDVRNLRDNFRNIQEFMSSQSNGGKNNDEDEQMRRNRDMRDNFKNIEKFKDPDYWKKDDLK